MRIVTNNKKLPINRIEILGENIASFEMKNNWEVSEIYFKDDTPAARLEEIFIVLRKDTKKVH